MKRFENWEKDFIRLSYPTYDTNEIAYILNRTPEVVKNYASTNKIFKEKIQIDIGSRFGHLTIIDKAPKTNKENKWKCLCDCGKESICTTHTLTSGHSRSCGCERLKAIYKGGKYVSGSFFKHIKDAAKIRNLEFNLTLEFLDNLIEKQNFKCVLSGIDIHIHKGRIEANYYEKTTASLDRIDNTKGYTEDNVQFLHKHINYMKWTHEQNYFIELCNKVSNNVKSHE